jgi:hypothetical protein
MAKFHGVGVSFGVSSSLAGVTGAFQTRDHNYQASNESIMDGQGSFVEDSTYGQFETAQFEYVATGAGPSGAATVTVPVVGDYLVVTDTHYTAIAQSNWIVRSVDVRGSNTTAARVTVNLWRAVGITI